MEGGGVKQIWSLFRDRHTHTSPLYIDHHHHHYLLNEVGDHDNDMDPLFPDHSPKGGTCAGQWTLEYTGAFISLKSK